MTVEKEISRIEREQFFLGPVDAVCDHRIKAHCLDPYYKHPKGCPNWGVKIGCPPEAPFFSDVYSKDVYIGAVKFNFEEYLFSRRQTHPDWTERAIRNPRHWQGHVRSEMRQFLFDYLSNHPEINGEILTNPEALGVNLFATCKKVGIQLEQTPQKFVYQVVLIANRLAEINP
jgi:predicted metal-binding protein